MTASIQVVKVGGSLLPLGPAPLRRWLAAARQRLPNASFVLIVGGGESVDALRRLDAREPIGEEIVHWLAIDQMAINTRLVAAWLALPIIDSGWQTLNNLQAGRGVAFDPRRFLREEEPNVPGDRLPIGWATTSDSIAARLAGTLRAGLTLLKSVEAPTPGDWPALADAGYVDAAFPAMAVQLSSVGCVALGDSASSVPGSPSVLGFEPSAS